MEKNDNNKTLISNTLLIRRQNEKNKIIIILLFLILCNCGGGGGGGEVDITLPFSNTVKDYSGKYVNVPLTLGLELNQIGVSFGTPITGNGCFLDSTFGLLNFSITGSAFPEAAKLTLQGSCPNGRGFIYAVDSILNGNDLVSSPSPGLTGRNCFNEEISLPKITTQKIETSLTCSDF